MARGINKVILIGNLGADPEVKYLPSGNAVTNLRLATDESYKDRQSGQMVPKTEWHRVVIFGKLAEIAGQYLKKGSKVYIEGKIQTRKWQDQGGQDRYSTEIIVDMNGQMQMLDSKGGNGDSSSDDGWDAAHAQSYDGGAANHQNVKKGSPNPGKPQRLPQAEPVEDFDDDIPF